MKLHNVPSDFRLIELTHVAPEQLGGRSIVPMQLFHHAGKFPESDNKIFVVAGFQGPLKHDAHITNLLQRAIAKNVFSPLSDVWLTPVVNPSSPAKQAWNNYEGLSMETLGKEPSREAETLLRWIQNAQPKTVIALTVGQESGVTASSEVPTSVTQRLAELMEKPVLEGEKADQRPLNSLRQWCEETSIHWIEMIIDDGKKSFDDIREQEWKRHFGPALKWLLEGERFNPPKEEPLNLEHLIVPALEMPPEFAHL